MVGEDASRDSVGFLGNFGPDLDLDSASLYAWTLDCCLDSVFPCSLKLWNTDLYKDLCCLCDFPSLVCSLHNATTASSAAGLWEGYSQYSLTQSSHVGRLYTLASSQTNISTHTNTRSTNMGRVKAPYYEASDVSSQKERHVVQPLPHKKREYVEAT